MDSFFQVDKLKWSEAEIEMVRHCPKALDLWWHLAPMTNALGVIQMSQKTMMKLLHVKSRTTINKAIKFMHDRHYLLVGKLGSQNVYILNPDLLKQTRYGTTKTKLNEAGIVFPSNVFITRGDDKNFYQEFKHVIKSNKTGRIDLKHIKFTGVRHHHSKSKSPKPKAARQQLSMFSKKQKFNAKKSSLYTKSTAKKRKAN